jgi:hypothetical protein
MRLATVIEGTPVFVDVCAHPALMTEANNQAQSKNDFMVNKFAECLNVGITFYIDRLQISLKSFIGR